MAAAEPAPARWQTPFFTLWSSQALSLFGSSLVQFALIWWLTSTTQSATVLALASLVGLLPNVILGPLAGVVVDRFSRKTLMLASDGVVAAVTIGLALLFATGNIQIWHVFVALFVRSAAGTVQFPAMQASTSLMVPDAHLARIAGLNQMLQGGMSIVAPPVGALLLETLPMQGVLFVDVGTAALAILILALVRIPQPARRPVEAGSAKPSFMSELRGGFSYVWRWPGMMIMLFMAMAVNFLLTPAAALLPILVTKHFQGGVVQLATVEAAFGIGVIVGGLLLGVWGGFKRRMVTALTGLLGIGLGFLLVGLMPASAFLPAVGFMFLAAMMNPITNGPLFAILQSSVAPDMQGRVFSLIGALSSLMAPLSLAIGGPVADALGVQSWYIIGGIACLVIAVSCFFIPSVMHLEDHKTDGPAPAVPLEPVPVAVLD
jgi:DHA3 family macrolide efflux protein-like MFS transporter